MHLTQSSSLCIGIFAGKKIAHKHFHLAKLWLPSVNCVHLKAKANHRVVQTGSFLFPSQTLGLRHCIINLLLCPAQELPIQSLLYSIIIPCNRLPCFLPSRILHCTHSYYLPCSPEKSIPVQTPSPAIQINKPSEGLSHSSVSPVCSLKA